MDCAIFDDCFSDCYNLTSVKILNDNISIDEHAFEFCLKINNFQIAITENITTTPTIKDDCFSYCPADRSLTFLTADGTTELSDSTTPTLAEAIKVYNAVDDGGIDDGYWYGWRLPEVGEVPDNEETFTITPEYGYRVSSILVDGNEVLKSEQALYYSESESSGVGNIKAGSSTEYYVFENVTDNHTLTAYFETINNDDNNNPDDSGDDNNSSEASNSNDAGGNIPDSSSVNDTGINNPVAISDPSVTSSSDIVSSISTTAPVSKDDEPKTGDASRMEVYAAIAMIAGLSYLLLYFADGKNGMTEEEKKEIVSALVKWAKKGKRLRKYAALAVIFLVLVYYHSIGKRTAEECSATFDWCGGICYNKNTKGNTADRRSALV